VSERGKGSPLLTAKRLQQIEQLFLADPDIDPTGRIMHLLKTDGLPGDRPLPDRTAKWYLQRVRQRLLNRAATDREERRALAIRRLDDLYGKAVGKGKLGEAAFIACRAADFDGARAAADEAVQPSLYEVALSLRARTLDWMPRPAPKKLPTLPPQQQRFWLERAAHLASKATDSAAAYRVFGAPPEDEMQRRLWLQKLQAAAAFLAATGPGLPPRERREAVARLASSYAMLTRDAELGGELEKIKGLLGEAAG
jgi:hypothetical protein